jgi:hypothetical protein
LSLILSLLLLLLLLLLPLLLPLFLLLVLPSCRQHLFEQAPSPSMFVPTATNTTFSVPTSPSPSPLLRIPHQIYNTPCS